MYSESTRFRLVLVALVACTALLVAAVPGVLGSESSSTDATMIVEGTTAEPGETVTVPIVVEGESIAGYQANLTWNDAVLRFESVEGVDLSDPVTNEGAGWVFMTQSQTEGVTSPTVARVTFTVVGDAGAETTVSFVDGDSSANNDTTQLPTALEDGTVTVEGEGGDDDGESGVGGNSVDDSTADGEDGTAAADGGAGDGDGSVSGADDTDAATDPDDGLSVVQLVLGLLGVGVVLGAGYALGQRNADSDDAN